MRFQILRTASIYMTVFWDTAPCNLMEVDILEVRQEIVLMMEAVRTSETSVGFYEIARCYIP
jgi:hypothetical protein